MICYLIFYTVYNHTTVCMVCLTKCCGLLTSYGHDLCDTLLTFILLLGSSCHPEMHECFTLKLHHVKVVKSMQALPVLNVWYTKFAAAICDIETVLCIRCILTKRIVWTFPTVDVFMWT